MDVLVLIDKLDDLVHNAKAVPLTDQVRIDREEIYDILDQMRATIPEKIRPRPGGPPARRRLPVRYRRTLAPRVRDSGRDATRSRYVAAVASRARATWSCRPPDPSSAGERGRCRHPRRPWPGGSGCGPTGRRSAAAGGSSSPPA